MNGLSYRSDRAAKTPIDKDTHGLLPVHVDEALGFVWLSFDAEPPPLQDALGAVQEEIGPYRLEEMRPIQEVTWTLDCNWKAVLDNATESYHIPVVHGGTIDPLTEDKPDFVTMGDHYRLTLAISDYGWRRAVVDRSGLPFSRIRILKRLSRHPMTVKQIAAAATVDAAGIVRGRAAGTTTITFDHVAACGDTAMRP